MDAAYRRVFVQKMTAFIGLDGNFALYAQSDDNDNKSLPNDQAAIMRRGFFKHGNEVNKYIYIYFMHLPLENAK